MIPRATIPYTPDNLTHLRAALRLIDADCEREMWFSLLCAIKSLHFDHGWPEDVVMEAADAWSKTGKVKYIEGKFVETWNSINSRDPSQSKANIGTVIHHARQKGWNGNFDRTEQDQAAHAAVNNQPFKNTDMGNAERLVARHGDSIRYVPELAEWFLWNGQHWQRDADGGVERLAKETVKAMLLAAVEAGDDKQVGFALGSQKAERLAAMIRLARSEMAVVLPLSKLDADPLLLGVKNGVVDLRTGNFRQGQKSDFITLTAGVEYVPGATCPKWASFINKLCGNNPALIEYMQKAHGYMLTGLVREEALFLEQGGGSNGKTTKREIMREVMGDYAGTADVSLLMERKQGGATPELARLRGKRLMLLSETAEDGRLNEQRVKTLTSNETICARGLYQDFFDFQPTHKVLLTTNHRPIIHGTDDGIWRRIHLIPSLMTIQDKDKIPDYREKHLMPELPGILNWLIEGVRRYLVEGLAVPTYIKDAVNQYRRDMDTVGQFLRQECVVDHAAQELLADVRQRYSGLCEREGHYALGAKKFSDQLREKGFRVEAGNGNRTYVKGLSLNKYAPTFGQSQHHAA